MNMRRNDTYRAVAEVLNSLGIPHSVEMGGRHPKVRFAVAGKPLTVVVSCSASDHKAYMNMRALTRRLVKQHSV